MKSTRAPLVRRAAAHFCAVLLGCAMVCAAARGKAEDAIPGQKVAALRVVDREGKVLASPAISLPLKEGQPFDMDAERESLRALYRTGLYADIHTEVTPAPGGLRVDFVVRRNFYNGVVQFEGLKNSRDESQALAAMRMSTGQIFRETDVRDGMARALATLGDAGLYQATATYRLTPHADTRQMDVTLTVVPGPRAKAGAITFVNQTEFADSKLREQTKIGRKTEVDGARLAKATDRLRKFLGSAGHLSARVGVERGSYDPKTNTVPLKFNVQAGPRVLLSVEGAKFGKSEIRKLVPIYEEGSVDEDLLQEGRRNLRDALQRQGYFEAQVTYTRTTNAQTGEEKIVYTAVRGSRHRLAGFAFDGNHYFATSLLESRLSMQAAKFASRGRFSEQLLASDTDSIRGLYASNGFRKAQVKSITEEDYQGRKGDLFVRFQIEEGEQTKVASLKVEGNQALSEADLLGVIGSTPGQPYSDANVNSDRDNVLAFYFNEGFPAAQFVASTEDAGENQVRLTYKVTEGQQVRVKQVFLTGYENTRPGVISRQVKVTAGGPLRESDVIETQRRLYNLAIFNRVTVAPQNPDGTEADKDVIVQVEEAKRYTVSYGGGLEVQHISGVSGSPVASRLDFSPRGIFEISKDNLFGRDQSIALKARASSFEYRGLLSYTIPDFFARQHFSLQVLGFADKSREVQTFTSTRYEGTVQVTENTTPFTTMLYRYFFRHVLVDASSLQIPEDEIPLFSQPTRVSGFGFTWLRDRRDNPADASRGSLNSVDVDLAEKLLGSSASFWRVAFQNSTYTRLGRSLTFARSVRFGVEIPVQGSANLDVPLPERFFAGGGTTLRGFGLNQAGPRDPVTGFPIGGLAQLLFNQEIRFPMHLPYAGNKLGGAIFYDAGNVFSDVGAITLRSKPKSPSNLEYFSHTVGFGIRYATPVGPVRVDFGYQINPATFSFTNSSTNQPQTSQLPHFQFFFNIGTIF